MNPFHFPNITNLTIATKDCRWFSAFYQQNYCHWTVKLKFRPEVLEFYTKLNTYLVYFTSLSNSVWENGILV